MLYIINFSFLFILGTLEQRLRHLDELIQSAERRSDELASTMATGGHPKDAERQKAIWDRKYKMLRKMKMGLEKIRKYLNLV